MSAASFRFVVRFKKGGLIPVANREHVHTGSDDGEIGRAATVAPLIGRVHGRGSGQAEAQEKQTSTRRHGHVGVGAGIQQARTKEPVGAVFSHLGGLP